jgi:hypothetical protein
MSTPGMRPGCLRVRRARRGPRLADEVAGVAAGGELLGEQRGGEWQEVRAEVRAVGLHLRGARGFTGRPLGKDWPFPVKLPKRGPKNSKRIVGADNSKRAVRLHLRGIWRRLPRPLENDSRFPLQRPKSGPENSKRIVSTGRRANPALPRIFHSRLPRQNAPGGAWLALLARPAAGRTEVMWFGKRPDLRWDAGKVPTHSQGRGGRAASSAGHLSLCPRAVATLITCRFVRGFVRGFA